jgi:hypothetical protein
MWQKTLKNERQYTRLGSTVYNSAIGIILIGLIEELFYEGF